MPKKNMPKDETPKSRSVSIRMSDSDLRALAEKCGRSGITISELFEVFTGDLINGSFYSGSDESMYASQWFDRHGFAWMNENSLLVHLIQTSSVDTIKDFLDAWKEKQNYDSDPFEIEELPFGCWWEDALNDALYGFERTPTKEDISLVKDWWEDYQKISKR